MTNCNKVIESIWDGYNNGSSARYDDLKHMRQLFSEQIKNKTRKERRFLLALFKIACHLKIRFQFNVNDFEKYIDSNLRAFAILTWLIETKNTLSAQLFFQKFNRLLSHQEKKQIQNELYLSENVIEIQLLSDSRYNKVRYFCNRQYSRPLIITFDPVDSNKRIGSFGIKFCVENKFDVVHFALAGKTQYQYLGRDFFFKTLKIISTKYPKTILYGSSLGGFAALYYSDIFNSDVIALSPYDPYHPYILKKFNKEINHKVIYQADIENFPVTTGRIIMTLDRSIPGDLEFYNHFLKKKFSKAELFFADYYGHPITTILQKTKQVRQVILAAIEGGGFLPNRKIIEQDSYYFYNQAIYLCRIGNFAIAKTVLMYALTIEDTEKYRKFLSLLESKKGIPSPHLNT